jgi:ABC-type sugar transport system substrate-binding protein
MQWPEPAHTEQSQARVARPTKGGAVRIRIALATATAVIALPAIFFAFFSGTSAASPRVIRHEASSQHRTVKIDDKLMSYSQAEYVAEMVNYSNAAEKAHEETYLTEVAYLKSIATEQQFLKSLAAQQQVAAQAAAATQTAAAAQAASAAAAARAPVVAAPAPVPTPAPSDGVTDATSTSTADWACIRQHESNDNYAEGNGGAYQFQFSTWNALTGLSSPAEDYPPAVQDSAALELYAQRGWQPWSTRYVCGL